MKRDLITIKDLKTGEINALFELASELKLKRKRHEALLKNKTLGLVFEKPSNRTRVSFEVGMFELGGNSIYLGSGEIELGKRESVKDAARVLSRYLDVIVVRTFSHKRLIEFAQHATVPVINGLTDLLHPCQGLSDLFTIKEKKGLKDVRIAFIGDGNNVLNSLLYGCNKFGIDVNVACPKGYEPDKDVIKDVKDIVHFCDSIEEAAKGADIIYTDVWTSMGKEKEKEKRLKAFQGFQINRDVVKLAKKDALIMHCLRAHRGEEITDDVLDGSQSIVVDQAENRLHVQKAILVKLLK